MIKAKLRDHVRSRTDASMVNESLGKILCHNVVVVHQSIEELGIDGTFSPAAAPARPTVVKFPGAA